ncbi:ATP-binding cassette domain-containing protein [Desulfitobacterium chlororespirans]|uniref:Peptide/nickel transport system ATP-binding protein n=1 Tax=Desulfitobacterium chlororespirans DSM 11544 TaxID=1121395 RepID=A0A1M7SJZ3_9FIRM|nr:dipeptide/oligopeptide/nickel ABC transporter ATP-binding protein [Desulfitobacterium chlororespirans]SHN58784.1 peptide/nickel transport system ATP-binding protein [Desulfitobacterium chlororespirans DSM 11544]
MAGIAAEGVSKSYGRGKAAFTALTDIHLQLGKEQIIALVGESGCGKSTLARLLVGLESPDQGKILLDGEDTSGWSYRKWRSRRGKIQAVFQDASGTLNPALSVYRNVESALVNLTALNSGERRERIEELMDLTGMRPALLKVPTRQLSGGEQRRMSLLRALAIRPDYLILDEVISGLDKISADAVLRVLEDYQQRFRCGCLFITHDKDSAYRLADRIVEMSGGRILRYAERVKEP